MKDPLEQFKLMVTYAIVVMHNLISMEKPFNAILGETYQCMINGVPVYLE